MLNFLLTLLNIFLTLKILNVFFPMYSSAVVSKNVKENEAVTGNLAIEHSKFIENLKKITKGEKIEKNMGD